MAGKRKRKRKIEMPEERFERDTMDAEEAAKRGKFRSETKFAKEIMDNVHQIGLQLKLDRLTKHSAFSFLTAVLQQLRNPQNYQSLGDSKKNLADKMSLEGFRKELKIFLDETLSNHPKLLEMKEEFEKEMKDWEEQQAQEDNRDNGDGAKETESKFEDTCEYKYILELMETEDTEKEIEYYKNQMKEYREEWEKERENEMKIEMAKKRGLTWNEYWNKTLRNNPGSWFQNQPTWFIQLTAWFLEMDIHIVDVLDSSETNPFEKISGNLQDSQKPCSLKVIIGSKTNIHYQSLLELEGSVPKAPEASFPSWKRTKPVLKGVCPICKFEFNQVLRHISLNKDCKEKVSSETVTQLQRESAQRRNEKKKENKSIRESWEISEQREERLLKKRTHMKRLRDKIKAENENPAMKKIREYMEERRHKPFGLTLMDFEQPKKRKQDS